MASESSEKNEFPKGPGLDGHYQLRIIIMHKNYGTHPTDLLAKRNDGNISVVPFSVHCFASLLM